MSATDYVGLSGGWFWRLLPYSRAMLTETYNWFTEGFDNSLQHLSDQNEQCGLRYAVVYKSIFGFPWSWALSGQ